MYADSDGARLWWCADGEGPPVLLVHAGAADLRMWDGVVAELQGQWRCVRFDMRGFGRTTYRPGPFAATGDVAAVAAAAGVDAAVVVGSSFGGLVAMNFAARYPQRVAKLVLLDPSVPDHQWSPSMEQFATAETAALEAGRVDEAAELNVRYWASDAPASARTLLHEMQARAFRLQLEAEPEPVDLEEPVLDRLAALRIPTLVAYGERDTEDFVAIAQRVGRDLPAATLHCVQGAGHLPALERPDVVARLIAGVNATEAP